MRINKISLRNYRQYRNVDIDFDNLNDNDLNILIASNGTGKTNLLNAINWCLYGVELTSKKKAPSIILNRKSARSTVGNKDVSVEIVITDDNSNKTVFSRKALFKLKNKKIIKMDEDFTIESNDDRGNTKILEDDAAKEEVERFVPEKIKEFFFFDGERLDSYFMRATGENIRNATFKISQIDELEKIEKNLSNYLNKMLKKAGNKYPDVQDIHEKINFEREKLSEIESDIFRRQQQIQDAKMNIERLSNELIGLPDIESYSRERKDLQSDINLKRELLVEKEKEKDSLILLQGKLILLLPAIINILNLIDEKKSRNEYPPPISEEVLVKILKEHVCTICGRNLDVESQEFVEKLNELLKSSGEDSKKLKKMETSLNIYKTKAMELQQNLLNISKTINGYHKDLENYKKRINEIDQFLTDYDEEKINKLINELKTFEESLGRNERKLGGLEEQKKLKNKKIRELEKELKGLIKKIEKLNELNIQKEFCTEALTTVINVKENIIEKTRKQIEKQTNRNFFDMIWKEQSFSDVSINDRYEISVFDVDGNPCLGGLGAAERQLLALSFTLALHEVSGFNSPILIDTPLGRVSDKQRENFSRTLLETSKNKQIILLFTPAEYSTEVSQVLEGEITNKYKLNLSPDETEVVIGGH